jgi:exopolysaccharide biosynthesis protein
MSENGTETAAQETNVTNADATIDETVQTAEQSTQDITAQVAETTESAENTEDVSYHTVEKEGKVTAIWEMQGRKHIRTIDPRSNEGKQILELFETAA